MPKLYMYYFMEISNNVYEIVLLLFTINRRGTKFNLHKVTQLACGASWTQTQTCLILKPQILTLKLYYLCMLFLVYLSMYI